MAFNSLDAQREACEAYIASQRHEGWIAVADRYDDGGISGGTLERPALQRLLRAIEANLVDVVIVYPRYAPRTIGRRASDLWSSQQPMPNQLIRTGSRTPERSHLEPSGFIPIVSL